MLAKLFPKLFNFRVISIFFLTLIVLFVLGIWWFRKPYVCKDCNVILISLDTLSALHLACYGYERDTAPNLCAFAQKNILFLNSYSQSSNTLDSHFSIFTSLHPHTHQMTKTFTGFLNEKYLTLAQVFRDNGYQTIYYGTTTDPHLPLDRGIERGFDIIRQSTINEWDKAYSQLIRNSEGNKPTFLFLHTYFVHDPYLTGHQSPHRFTDLPEYPNIPLDQEEYRIFSPVFLSFVINSLKNGSNTELLEKFEKAKNIEGSEEIFNRLSSEEKRIYFRDWNQGNVNKNDPDQIEYLKALYDEQIYNLDQKLSKLFEILKDPKLAKKTLLVITADHGEEFMEHGNLYHDRNIYRTSTAVPLIMYIPGVKAKKITDLVQGIDIYPTVLKLTGLSIQSDIEGMDLSESILKDNAQSNNYVLSEYKNDIAIQDQQWRYYYKTNSNYFGELYDIRNDPVETKNLKDFQTGIVSKMLQAAKNIRKENI